jgi:hypothetical protein
MRAFYVCGDPQKSGGCQIIVTTKRELLDEEKSGLSVVLDRCRFIFMNNLMSAAISVLKLVLEQRGGVLDLQCAR